MSPQPSRWEAGLFACLLLVLVWAPLPFASNRVWGAMLLTTLIALLCAAWAMLYLAGRTQLQRDVWRIARWPLLALLGVQCWVLLQLLPLPRWLLGLVSPQADAWWLTEGPASISLDPEATRQYLLKGLAVTGAFFLTVALVNTADRMKLLLQTLVFSGTAQAIYGSMMVLTGLEYGFLIEKYASLGSASGTFVNRNHYAGYLVMCLAAGIGLLLSQLSTRSSNGWRDRIRRYLQLMLSSKMRLRIYLALMVIALVLTRSRMGNVAFFTALGVTGSILLISQRRFSWRIPVFLGSLLVVDLLILGQWFGLDKVVERLEQTAPDTEARVDYFKPGLDYVSHFPMTGSGGGSFYGIFPNFQPPNVEGYLDHAHNDYVEFAAELGVPVLLVLGALVLAAAWQSWLVLRMRHTRLYQGAAFAVLMTIVWLLLHAAVDFNMQIPANAVTFAAILSLAWIARGLPAVGEPCHKVTDLS
ncbi:polymerase [Halioglobus japonicus]|uniref:O-antigen ligase domain-containing protein n=2 Tax=Halioglobus japonicus TaxID=930805 RepID=A0AAP8MBR0_9GAMM|nr:O-antigen ligase domain-containing protein [Halioglobus japonicus]GHD21495.1 polymerase [Halioglobus japonicus]